MLMPLWRTTLIMVLICAIVVGTNSVFNLLNILNVSLDVALVLLFVTVFLIEFITRRRKVDGT